MGSDPIFLALQRLDVRIQPRLVPGSVVPVDETLAGHSIDDGHRCLEGGGCVVVVAPLDGTLDFLDSGARHRAQARIVASALLALAGALACGAGIGQRGLLEEADIERRANMPLSHNLVNLLAARCMEAPAFPEFLEAKLQKILGKWEHLQIAFADA